MEAGLILRKRYRIGRQDKSIWIRAFGDRHQIAQIKISATALSGSQQMIGAAARQLDLQLREYFQGRFARLRFDRLPLQENGSGSYQRACMKFLAGIPLGQTRSYQQEACSAVAAGKKPSPRAAGQANRRNLFPIVVPCHRVVASSGSSQGGFMGGVRPAALALKRALLAHEADAFS